MHNGSEYIYICSISVFTYASAIICMYTFSRLLTFLVRVSCGRGAHCPKKTDHFHFLVVSLSSTEETRREPFADIYSHQIPTAPPHPPFFFFFFFSFRWPVSGAPDRIYIYKISVHCSRAEGKAALVSTFRSIANHNKAAGSSPPTHTKSFFHRINCFFFSF